MPGIRLSISTVAMCLLLNLTMAQALFAQSGRRPVTRDNNGSVGSATSSSSGTSGSDATIENEPTPDPGVPETVEGDVVPVNTTLVTVPVSVMDRNGKYIPDLRRSDFRVFENGVEQRIAYFATV